MSQEHNETLVRRYFQQVSADYFAPDATLHDLSQTEPLRGRPAIAAFLKAYLHDAFPDGRYELRRVLTDPRGAAAEWTFHGTNTGSFLGAEPTGRTVEFHGVSTYVVRDGAFSQARVYYDTGRLAEQLGLVGERVAPSERARVGEWWGDGGERVSG